MGKEEIKKLISFILDAGKEVKRRKSKEEKQ